MSEKPAIDPRNLRAFNQALQEYVKYNRQELGPILENRANRIRWQLYRLFRDISPDKAKLNAELDALGGRVRRRTIRGKMLTLDQEKRKRRGSLKYLSVSFMLRDWRISREGQNAKRDQRNRLNRRIGEVIDRTARGVFHPSVQLTSFLDGAVKMNVERALVNQALNAQTADMRRYILRKQREAQARTVAKINAFTKGLTI